MVLRHQTGEPGDAPASEGGHDPERDEAPPRGAPVDAEGADGQHRGHGVAGGRPSPDRPVVRVTTRAGTQHRVEQRLAVRGRK